MRDGEIAILRLSTVRLTQDKKAALSPSAEHEDSGQLCQIIFSLFRPSDGKGRSVTAAHKISVDREILILVDG